MVPDGVNEFKLRLRNLGKLVDLVVADVRCQRQQAAAGGGARPIGKNTQLAAAHRDILAGIAEGNPHGAFQRAHVKNLEALDLYADLAAVEMVVRGKRIRDPK